MTEYLAWNLLTNYGTSAEITSFVDKYDFYIFPVVNPDGKDMKSPPPSPSFSPVQLAL